MLSRVMMGSVAVACASVGAAPDAWRDVAASKGPVLWYRFGEPAGATGPANAGSFGASQDGTATAVTFGEASFTGDTAAGFSFAADSFVVSDAEAPTALLGNPSFTTETLVFIPEGGVAGQYGPYLHWGDGSVNGGQRTLEEVYFSVRRSDADIVYAGFYNAGMRTVCRISKGRWHHIVWVRDSGGGLNDAYTGSTVYVNGEVFDLQRDEQLFTNLDGIAPNVQSGAFHVQRAADFIGQRHFDGTIDEVVLYDRVLTASEVVDLFAATGLPGNAVCIADLALPCGELTFGDISAFLMAFSSGDAAADLAAPFGQLTFGDISTFLAAFAAGCP
jgi:hypothetical protein